ncbi:BUD13 homolog isoform X2 [Hemiscyllium ocellatum]|uniref:BUD13 homolog isoform X2 n=1 Tax=Hemiscyllium ocellatum TaxID=170820 RepID=UPI0029677265|nr:BUD13 homolog isoform X2 [Hemiscyllium ocellatum]
MAGLSKEEYLKRYLSGAEPGHKRTRKKRKVKIKGGGMRIVDDDVTWKSLEKEKEKEAAEDEDDEAPVVAEFIDERPEIVQQMEEFRLSNKWKILGDANEEFQDADVFLHASQDGLITGSELAQRKKIETDSQVSERKTRRISPDLSPPRRGRHDSPDLSPPRRGRHDSPDLSPPRRGRHDSPDPSPPRRGRHDSPDLSPPRRGRHDSPDPSPPRRGRHDSPDLSPPRRGRHDSPDLSPPRRGRHDSPDLSPPRRGRHDSPDLSPPRRGRHGSLDLSPPRKLSKNTEKCIKSTDLPPRRTRSSSPDLSPARCKRHDSSDSSSAGNAAHSSDSDLSPPRKRQSSSLDSQTAAGRRGANAQGLSPSKQKNRRTTRSPRRWQHPDSDLSPPRKRGQRSSDSDLSPPRRKRPGVADTEYTLCSDGSELSPARHGLPSSKLASSRRQGASWDMSPSRKSQGNEMLSGGQTGLISTEILRKEKEHRRQRERAADCFADDSRHATTVFRDKSGKKRDLDQERILHKKKEEEKAAKQEKYAQWGKGVAQEEQQRKNVQDALHEMQKPLARHIDDEDLDRFLREKLRDGDPMAGLLGKKKEKEAKNKNDRMALNRNVMRDWQIRRLCRRLHTNGVWRICKLLIEIRGHAHSFRLRS